MMKKDWRIVPMAALVMAFAGGCAGADQSMLGTFLCDLLTNALAAILF